MGQDAKKTGTYIAGQLLRKMRIHGGKTTSEVAEAVGVKSRKTIENWEREFCEPTINQFLVYCTSVGFHPGKIVAEVAKLADAGDISGIELDTCILNP